jgi:hypothetical protein
MKNHNIKKTDLNENPNLINLVDYLIAVILYR